MFGIVLVWLFDWAKGRWTDWSTAERARAVVLAVVAVSIVAAWILGRNRGWRLRAAVLAAALAVAATSFVVVDGENEPGLDACGRTPAAEAVEVMVVWERAELRAFCEVVEAYGDTGSAVAVRSVGIDIGAALTDAIADGNPPDAAIIPQPSLVRRLGRCGQLVRLNGLEALDHAGNEQRGIPSGWTDLVTTDAEGESPQWGAFVKGAHKSIFWYRTEELAAEPDPRSGWAWATFADWVERYAGGAGAEAGVPPLTLAAGDRWPLTDWFENQLALVDPDLYHRLSDGQPIGWDRGSLDNQMLREALSQIAAVWGQDGVFPEGAIAPGETIQDDLAERLRQGDVAAVFHPSFLGGEIDDLYASQEVRAFRFPGLRNPERPRLVVGGDIAVVPVQDGGSSGGEAFVDWLTGAEAMRAWSAEDPGYLTPNWGSPSARPPQGDENDFRDRLTTQMLQAGTPGEGELFFDLSDDQFATRNESDPRAIWTTFDQFFTAATTNGDQTQATDSAVAALEEEYRRPEPPCP